MKRNLTYLAVAAVIAAMFPSCAKQSATATNKANKLYFDSWVTVNKERYPDYLWKQTELGSYILEMDKGSGESLTDDTTYPYIYATYTLRDLEGNVQSTSEELIAKQIGTYDQTYYFGPYIWYRADQNLYAGLEEVIKMVNVGGSFTVVIPGWLATYNRYDTAQEYLENETGSNVIYSATIKERIKDATVWEVDSLIRYVKAHYPKIDVADTVEATTTTRNRYGYYYVQTQPPTKDTTYAENNSIFIEYIGRFLDGKVFDTNIQDTAKRYNLYSSSSTYEPMEIKWGTDSTELRILTDDSEESEMIAGMARCLWKMKEHEAGICMFYSGLGYGYEGVENTIPPYCPLTFEIQLVDDPDAEDE